MTSDSKWKFSYTPPPSEWFYSHNASAIFCPSAKGGERTILDMRGWGYLTGKGHGALGLDSETAAKEQDALAEFIIEACRRAASPQPPAPGAEVVAPEGYWLVPHTAMMWLFGEGPDDNGYHFGDGPEADAEPRGSRYPRRFWWRGVFRRMVDKGAPRTPPTAEITRRASPWQPIETAPKDGEWIVALEGDDIYKCRWQEQDDGEGRFSSGWFDYINQSFESPTHWMPLAKPPGETGAGQL